MSGTLDQFRDKLTRVQSEQDSQRDQIVRIERDRQNDLADLKKDIGVLGQKIDDRAKPRTAIWIAALSVVVVAMSSMGGVAWVLIQQSIENKTQPQTQEIAGLKEATRGLPERTERTTQDVAALKEITRGIPELAEKAYRSRESDARSDVDRGEINRRVAAIELQMNNFISETRERTAYLQASAVESETQFKNVLALIYYLWNQVTGSPFPIVPREAPISPRNG